MYNPRRQNGDNEINILKQLILLFIEVCPRKKCKQTSLSDSTFTYFLCVVLRSPWFKKKISKLVKQIKKYNSWQSHLLQSRHLAIACLSFLQQLQGILFCDDFVIINWLRTLALSISPFIKKLSFSCPTPPRGTLVLWRHSGHVIHPSCCGVLSKQGSQYECRHFNTFGRVNFSKQILHCRNKMSISAVVVAVDAIMARKLLLFKNLYFLSCQKSKSYHIKCCVIFGATRDVLVKWHSN